MARPRKFRCVWNEPGITYFKPRGIPVRELEEIVLSVEELEAIRLKDLDGLKQEEAAGIMEISRPTFHRVLNSGRSKIADALIKGKALRIEGGDYKMAPRKFKCGQCGIALEIDHGTPRPTECPKCKSLDIHRSEEDRGYNCQGGAGKGRCGRSSNK